ncbi:MAG: dipicolinate synthase subunit DpsA [Lachnospiraceae bacterium]
MTYEYDFALVGGDERQLYLSELLKSSGNTVCGYALAMDNRKNRFLPALEGGQIKLLSSFQDTITNSHYIIGPIPFSRDNSFLCSNCCSKDLPLQTLYSFLTREQLLFGGIFSKEILTALDSGGFQYKDLMKSEEVAIGNSVATAEGAIFEAIQNSPRVLHHSSCLILGFGRCGQILAHKLKGLDCAITVSVRSTTALSSAYAYGYNVLPLHHLGEEAANFEYIFNTIPAMVLPKEILCHISPETTIIDLASDPGGLDYTFSNYMELNTHLRLGLPGKIAPCSSAKILYDEILKWTFPCIVK